MGARCLSFVNQEVASIRYIHYLRLPGFNVYISGDLRSPPPSRKKESGGGGGGGGGEVFCLGLNVRTII